MRPVDISDESPVAVADPGPAPMLQWVRIDSLVIDDAYQRPLARGNWTHIRKIAGAFAWSRFSPVFCAPTTGGRFALIDGQHRAHAAALCGFDTIPAVIVQMPAAEQARAFTAINAGTVRMNVINVFRAAVAAEEAWAVELDRVVSAAGCRVLRAVRGRKDRKPGDILTIRGLSREIAAGRAASVEMALAGLLRSEEGAAGADVWIEPVMLGLISAVVERDWIGDADALARLLDEFEVRELVEAARRRSAGNARAGAQVALRDLVAQELGRALDRAAGRAVEPAPEPVAAAPVARPAPRPPASRPATPSAEIGAAPWKGSDWTAAEDHELMFRTVMGRSDGNIAAQLRRKPPEIRARRAHLLNTFASAPGDCLKILHGRVVAEEAAKAELAVSA